VTCWSEWVMGMKADRVSPALAVKGSTALVAGAILVVVVGIFATQAESHTLLGVALLTGALAVFSAGLSQHIGARVWTSLAGSLFLGYALFGKGFSYLAVPLSPPVYIGEAALFFVVVGVIASPWAWRRLKGVYTSRSTRAPMMWLTAFMSWQLVRAVPFVRQYGLDAIRDSALWYYGIFAVGVAVLTRIRSLPSGAMRPMPLTLLSSWFLLAFVLSRLGGLAADSPVGQFVSPKSGDVQVALAAIGAMAVLGMSKGNRSWSGSESRLVSWVAFWLIWVTTWLVFAMSNRGGMLSVIVGLGTLWAIRRGRLWILAPIALGLWIGLAAFTSGMRVPFGKHYEVSVEQLVTNVVSVFSEGEGKWEGTKEWRLNWWTEILRYTTDGTAPLGKGYGVNLADSDGYQVNRDGSLRSPHNAAMSVLARSGLAGLGLWIGFVFAMLLSMLQSLRVRSDEAEAADVILVTGVWLLAALVNSSFDVYLEGPQGGVPFWICVGVALSALMRRDKTRST